MKKLKYVDVKQVIFRRPNGRSSAEIKATATITRSYNTKHIR